MAGKKIEWSAGRELMPELSRWYAERMLKELMRGSPLLKAFGPRVPLTRWQRMKNRARNLRDRIELAWRVLRTGDVD